MPDLEITATGNVSGAVSAIDTLGKAIQRIPAPFANSAKGVEAFTRSLKNVTPSIDPITPALNKMGTGSNQASQALLNLGRVAQDAPYGFIGIANNLNPLLEGFQRLRKETGSNALALKALGSSLIGGGGIGLALSAVTAILQFSQLGLSAWTRGMGSSKAAVDKVAESLKEFKKESAEGFGKEAANLLILKGAIESVNTPMATRLQAVKDLKKEFPGLFDGLSTEQLLTGNVANAYDLATQAILRKARASAAAAQLEKISAEKLKILEKAELDRAASLEKSAKAQDKIINNAAIGPIGTVGKTKVDLQKEIISLYNIRAKAAQDEINQLNKQQDFYLKIAIEGADRTIEIEKNKVKKIKEVRGSDVKQDQLAGIFLDIPEPTLTVRPDVKMNLNLKSVEIDPASQKKVLDAMDKFLLNAKITDAINATLDSLIQDTLNNLISGIAEVIAGTMTVPDLFDGLIKGIGSQVTDLGKYMVKLGLEMLIAQKAIKALGITPAGAILVGFGLQVLGALLTAAATKKMNNTGFASGGTVNQSGFYNVGERGQERIFLSQGTRVQPNNEVAAYGSGVMQQELVTRISGVDLEILLQRGQAKMGRNN